MADTIAKGITITFRGDTAEFDKGVSQINSELKDLKNETKLLNRELKLDPNNLNKLTEKLTTLQKQEDLIKEKIEAYQEALSKMDKGSAEFEKTSNEVRNLQIELGYLQKSIEKLGGNQLSLALNVLGNNLENVGSKVSDLGQKFQGVSAAAAGVLAGFGKLSYDVIKSADDINTLAKQTGLSTDTLQAFGQMADLIDVDLSTLSKSALYLTKNLDNKSTLETYKKLGIAVKDNNGAYRKSEDILFDSLKALQQVDDETERALLANDLFGKSYSNLGSIINDASVDLEEVNRLVQENGTILSTDQLNALNGVNDQIDTLKMKFGGLKTSLVADFQEPITKIINKVVELADKVIAFVNNLSTEQKERIVTVLAVVATIAPALMIVGGLIEKVGGAIKIVSGIIQVIIPIIQGLFTLIMANPLAAVIALITAMVAIIVVLIKNFDTVKEKVSEVWEKFKQTEFVQNLIEYFEKFKDVLDRVIESIKGVFNWISDTIGKVGEFLSSGIQKVVGWFSSGGFGNVGAYASGGYGSLELKTTINVNNNGQGLSPLQAQQFGRQIVEYVNDKLGRRI